MSFELIVGRHLSRVFYAEAENYPGNVLAFVYRDGEGHWEMLVRARVYLDDKVGRDSRDIKKGFLVKSTHTELPECLPRLRLALQALAGEGAELEEIIIDSSDPGYVLQRIQEQPWANVSIEEKGLTS